MIYAILNSKGAERAQDGARVPARLALYSMRSPSTVRWRSRSSSLAGSLSGMGGLCLIDLRQVLHQAGLDLIAAQVITGREQQAFEPGEGGFGAKHTVGGCCVFVMGRWVQVRLGTTRDSVAKDSGRTARIAVRRFKRTKP